MDYQGPERRKATGFTEEELDAIADRAAERALAKVYEQIGRSVVTKFLWVAGVAVVAIVVWVKGGALFK